MRIHIKQFIIPALALLCSFGCRKDDSPFIGKDNNIASFSLRKGDMIFKGAISPDSIVVSAPENFDLANAVSTMVLSEKASIQPDPASITDWNQPQDFTVTAYNGGKRTYKYRVARNVISSQGDVLLVTQADVKALDSMGITEINGSLTIGKTSGPDSITSLSALSKLKRVRYDLIINPTYAGKTLAGLQNITAAGSIQINQVMTLDTATFPQLSSIAGDLVINASGVKSIQFPQLVNIDLGMQLTGLDYLSEMSFPKLESLLGNLTIQGNYTASNLETVALPAVKTIGGNIFINQLIQLKAIRFAALTTASSIAVNSFESLLEFSAPQLQNVKGNLDLSFNINLTTLDLSSLESTAGSYRMDNIFLLDNLAGLRKLSAVGGDLSLSTLPSLKSLSGLSALQSVGGSMTLSGFDQLEDANLEGLSSLKEVDGDIILAAIPFKKFSGFGLTTVRSLTIYGNGITSIEAIDLSKLNITNALTLSNISTPAKLSGKDAYDCSITIESSPLEITGFKTVKDFTFNYFLETAPSSSYQLPVTQVTGNLALGLMGIAQFSMPELFNVTGNMNVDIYATTNINLPKLKTSGKMTFNTTASGNHALALPALQNVAGDLTITTDDYRGVLGSISFPALTAISGALSLAGSGSDFANMGIKNLNGLSALTSVSGVNISWNQSLADFTGLKAAFRSCPTSAWQVANNLYNPSYQDMLDGKYK